MKQLPLQIDRRQVLQGLAACGANIILSSTISCEQVQAEWQRLGENPWYFDVGEWGTILNPEQEVPILNSDIYGKIDLNLLRSAGDIIRVVELHDELASYFSCLANDELECIEEELASGVLDEARKEQLETLREALIDGEEGWRDWITSSSVSELNWFKSWIGDWLSQPVDWGQMESWPIEWSAQGKALRFFQDFDAELQMALGVVIVEGDHPGSTYFAAELSVPAEDANRVARALQLPFRFRRQGDEE